jgi:hypothetical protein
MDLVSLFIWLLVFCLVLGLAYWMVTLVVSIIPAPMQNPARVILLILLCLIAISILLGMGGIYDAPWTYGAHRHGVFVR